MAEVAARESALTEWVVGANFAEEPPTTHSVGFADSSPIKGEQEEPRWSIASNP